MSPTPWASVETLAFRKDIAKILYFFENIGGVQQNNNSHNHIFYSMGMLLCELSHLL